MDILKDKLSELNLDYSDLAKLIRKSKRDTELAVLRPVEKFSIKEAVKIATLLNVSLDVLVKDVFQHPTGCSQEDYDHWKSKGLGTTGKRYNFILGLSAETSLDIAGLLYEIIINKPTEKSAHKYKGVPLSRIEYLKEKYKNHYIPKWDINEIRQYIFANKKEERVSSGSRKKWRELRSRGVHLSKPLPINHPARMRAEGKL